MGRARYRRRQLRRPARAGGRARSNRPVPGAPGTPAGEAGNVAILAALAMVVLLGMAGLVLDGGRLYTARLHLQGAADAAALAAANSLPEDPAGARQQAYDYAAANGSDPDRAQVTVSGDGSRVRVHLATTVPMGFARVLGIQQVTVSAAAEAEVGGAMAVSGVQPFGIDEQPLRFGERYTLVLDRPGSPGNFHLLALGGRGADDVRENIRHGYPGWLRVGQTVETEPGHKTGAVQAYRERIEADPHSTYTDYPPDSPRLVIVPVVRGFDETHGRDTVTIAGFAAFFLEEAREDEGQVVGRFIRHVVEGEPGPVTADTGVRVVRLVD
ncbi:MAG TPA: pilus assembly protein TadG-related protein [Thermaerobacter sp.]